MALSPRQNELLEAAISLELRERQSAGIPIARTVRQLLTADSPTRRAAIRVIAQRLRDLRAAERAQHDADAASHASTLDGDIAALDSALATEL